MRIDIKTIVKKPFNDKLIARTVSEQISSILQKGAFRIEADAKKRATVAFGIMRASIHVFGPIIQQSQIYWQVIVGAAYAKFIEFGTGPAGKKSKLLPQALKAMRGLGYRHGPGNFFPPVDAIAKWAKRKGIDESLVWVIARSIGRKGIPAQPFLYPAFVKNIPKILADFRGLKQRIARGR